MDNTDWKKEQRSLPALRRSIMKLCPNCEYLNPEGFLFCEDCGESLTHAISVPAPPPEPDHPSLYVVVNSVTFTLSVDERWIVGRTDKDNDNQPDVDLSVCDALDQGVSVRHAVIYFDCDWYIEDLDSTNGTYIDGMRLLPGRRIRLRPDQYIRLGRLPLQVDFASTAPLYAITDDLSLA